MKVTVGEMKALLVLMLTILAAGTAFAYGRGDAGSDVAAFVEETASAFASEPVVLLLSGGLLIAIAGAVRRMPV